jgi:hypothetical protein
MSFLRIIGGVLGLAAAATFAWPAVALFRPVVLPLLRGAGTEPTYFYILSVGSLSLSGWQIVAFEAALVVSALSLLVLAVYAFSVRENGV